MPRVDIPVQTIGPYGAEIDQLVFTAGDHANDHSFKNTGREFLLMKNDAGGAKQATVVSVANARTFGRTGDRSLDPGAAKVAMGGPYPPDGFNQPDGTVNVDSAELTSVSFAVVAFTPTPA